MYSVHLSKPKYGILDVVIRLEGESYKTVPQMMPKRPNTYRVSVKVYASKSEHHLPYCIKSNGNLMLEKYLVSQKVSFYYSC